MPHYLSDFTWPLRRWQGQRNRTPNLRFWRPTLCQLSYTPTGSETLESLIDGSWPRRRTRRRCGHLHGWQSAEPSSMAIGAISLTVIAHVVARHHHLFVLGQLNGARHVRRAEVKLRTVVVEERRVTATFVLGQHIDLSREVRVRLDASRACTALGRAARLRAWCRAAKCPRCRPLDPGPAACGTSPRQCRWSFACRLDADDLDFFAHFDHMPRSIRPVTTVPRPEIENTSSTGIRNAPSMARSGVGM
jgi:hypothetical protein